MTDPIPANPSPTNTNTPSLVENPFKPARKPEADIARVNAEPKSSKPTKASSTKRIPKKRNVGSKTNAAELEFRYAQVAEWIAQGKKKHQCKELAKEKWGIQYRTFENYHTEAYKRLLAASDTTPEEEYLKSCAYYDSVMADDSNTPEVRLAARVAKDKLTGIQRPRKVAMTDADGDVITPVTHEAVIGLTMAVHRLTAANLTDEELKKLSEAAVIYATVNTAPSEGEPAAALPAPLSAAPRSVQLAQIHQGEGAPHANLATP